MLGFPQLGKRLHREGTQACVVLSPGFLCERSARMCLHLFAKGDLCSLPHRSPPAESVTHEAWETFCVGGEGMAGLGGFTPQPRLKSQLLWFYSSWITFFISPTLYHRGPLHLDMEDPSENANLLSWKVSA